MQRAEQPSAWQQVAQAPLIWRDTAPAVVLPEMPEEELPVSEEAPVEEPRSTPPDLLRLLELHETTGEPDQPREDIFPDIDLPNPFDQQPKSEKPTAPRPPSPRSTSRPPVQRAAAPPQTSRPPSPPEKVRRSPKVLPGQRLKGALLEEVTRKPTKPVTSSWQAEDTPPAEPTFEQTDFAASEQPDLIAPEQADQWNASSELGEDMPNVSTPQEHVERPARADAAPPRIQRQENQGRENIQRASAPPPNLPEMPEEPEVPSGWEATQHFDSVDDAQTITPVMPEQAEIESPARKQRFSEPEVRRQDAPERVQRAPESDAAPSHPVEHGASPKNRPVESDASVQSAAPPTTTPDVTLRPGWRKLRRSPTPESLTPPPRDKADLSLPPIEDDSDSETEMVNYDALDLFNWYAAPPAPPSAGTTLDSLESNPPPRVKPHQGDAVQRQPERAERSENVSYDTQPETVEQDAPQDYAATPAEFDEPEIMDFSEQPRGRRTSSTPSRKTEEVPVVRRSEAPREFAPSSDLAPDYGDYSPENPLSPAEEHRMDLFEALLESGTAALEPKDVHRDVPDISLKRSEPRTPTQPPAPTSEPAGISPEGTVPEADSPEAGLLELLDLPPDTPVVGLQPSYNERRIARSPIQRQPSPDEEVVLGEWEAVEPDYGQETPPAETSPRTIQREPLSPEVLRREVIESTSQAIQSNPQLSSQLSDLANQPENERGPNIDKLARDVYRLLQERLRIEQERRSGKR
jgi:hypothetical protein